MNKLEYFKSQSGRVNATTSMEDNKSFFEIDLKDGTVLSLTLEESTELKSWLEARIWQFHAKRNNLDDYWKQ